MPPPTASLQALVVEDDAQIQLAVAAILDRDPSASTARPNRPAGMSPFVGSPGGRPCD